MTPSKVNQYDLQTTTYKTAGTASAYTLTIPKLASLVDEFTFVVEFHIENDASATLNINSLGAIAINTGEGNAIGAGDLKTTGRYTLVYDADTARFIVSETVDSEVESMIGGSGTIIPGFNESEDIVNATVLEAITSGEYCCLTPYEITQTTKTQDYGTAGQECGESVVIPEDMTLDEFTIYCRWTGAVSNSIAVLRVYACTGTPGINGAPTGPVLYTTSYNGGSGFGYPSHTFEDLGWDLTAGNYVFTVQLSGWSSNPAYLRSSSSDVLANANAVAGGVVDNTVDLTFEFKSYPVMAVPGDASDTDRITRLGQAQCNYSPGATGSFKRYGEGDQTGATNDGAIRYLSDTPGELSLTPGTNVRIIGQGSDTDKVWMGRTHYHEMNDINQGEVYYTNIGGLCGGWFKNAVGSFVSTAIGISISEDNVTRDVLQSNQYDQSTGNQAIGIQAYIPAGYYFKIDVASTTTITSERYYFNPIK